MDSRNRHIVPKIDLKNGIEFGIYTLADHLPNPYTKERISAGQRIKDIIEMGRYAEQAGFDIFQVGESHQDYFVGQAHTVILSALAQATKTIKLSSGSTIISTSDPVRVFEDAATIDLISDGRMELVAGRASRVGLYDLLGYNLDDYEALFEEKFKLLLEINENEYVNWQGEYRAPLKNAHVIPRPDNEQKGLPIWRAVGGALASAYKAGQEGVPMYLAHLGGPAEAFKSRVDVYREAAVQAGHDVNNLPIATAGFLFAHENMIEAYKQYYPHINEGHMKTNGSGFPKAAFNEGKDRRSVLNVGDPKLIVEKILYQHELFNNSRYIGQLDFGGVPLDDVKRNIDIIGEKILPEVKKHTRTKEEE